MELQTNHGDKQMDKGKDTVVEAILEQLIETGPTDIASVFARAFVRKTPHWGLFRSSSLLAVAEMYIKGVSTRDVEAVMAEFGVVCLSSSQVSRAAKLLDEELAARAATAHSARSSISSSTPGTRRCAMAGSCAMSPSCRLSA
jgi:hypothetical protein